MKRKIKAFVIIVLCVFIIGISAFSAVNIYIVSYAKPYIISEAEAESLNKDCVIALGAQVYSDGTPYHQLYDRVKIASEIFLENSGKKLLLSGDSQQSEKYDEISAMKKVAADFGVNEEDMLDDPFGLNTYSSMERLKDVFGFSSAVIVTQQYHIYRSIYIARKMGIEAYGVCSDPREYATIVYNEARESLARIKAFYMMEIDN